MVSKNVSSIRWDHDTVRYAREKAWRERRSLSEVLRSLLRQGIAQDLAKREAHPDDEQMEDEEAEGNAAERTTPPAKARAH